MDTLIKIGTNFIKKSSKFYTFFLKDKMNNHIMTGNYSNKKNIYRHLNIEKRPFYITNITIFVSDNGTFNDQNYGSECKLEKGIKMYIKGLGYKRNIFGLEEPILRNSDWLKYNSGVEIIKMGNRRTIMRIKFNFHTDTDTYIKLYPSESICLDLNDDFSTLFEQTVNITGHYGTKD
tara:strand:- start:9143 stop:9673 length:531 start_codon:yes stop_codon:yes gene_type:complete